MKKLYYSFLLTPLLLLTSCVSGSDSSDTIYYDDVAVVSFSLSNVKQLTTTTDDDGNETQTYKKLDVSSYKFAIDQARHLIYNVDSLPVGVDPTKIVCTASAKNGGYIKVKTIPSEEETDEYKYFSSSDSLDFTGDRTFRVFSMTGQNYADYTIKVNIHKEVADSFVWRPRVTVNAQLAALSHLRLVSFNGQLLAFGVEGSQTVVYSSAETDGRSWTKLSVNIASALSNAAPYNVVKYNSALYLFDQGVLYTSADGQNWSNVSSPSIKQLLGGSTTHLYAIANSGNLCTSADDGLTWQVEEMDAAASLLPTQDFSFACTPLRSYASSNQLVLLGNRDIAGENAAQVWGKVEQNDASAEQQAWTYYTVQGETRELAPHLSNLQMVVYDDALLAFGGAPMNASTLTSFAGFYKSEDAGITWPLYTSIHMPEGFSSNQHNFAITVDSKQYIWIICGGTGQVWRGRINRLGWQTPEQYVTQ